MLKSEARSRFDLIQKQQHHNSSWKKAVSWLYHCEPESEVVETFCLDSDQLISAKFAVYLLANQKADYDRVHAWANKEV